jgi:thiamine kinase-like enzyme
VDEFPRRVGEVTTSWLQDQVGGHELRGFSLERIAQGVGFIGELYRVRLDWAHPSSEPASVVLKTAVQDPAAKQVAALFDFFGKEVNFYRLLAPRTAAPVPKCYAAFFDPAEQDFVILMEDGGAGSLLDQVDGCDEARARIVVEELASLHASWWQSSELEAIDWLPRWSAPLYAVGVPQAIAQAWPHVGALLADSVPAWFRARWDDYHQAVPSMLQRLDGMARTLAHGDARLDNLLFDTGSHRVMMIDWQVPVQGPGVFDVGYFLSQSLPTELRRRIEADILTFYRRCLVERGVDAPSMDQLWDGYRTACLFSFVYPVIGGSNTQDGDTHGVRLLQTAASRCIATIADQSAMELL